MLFSSRLRLRLDLVSGWLVVMHTYLYILSVVIVTLPDMPLVGIALLEIASPHISVGIVTICLIN